MTLIQSHGYPQRERTFEVSFGFLPPLESNHNKAPIDPPIIGSSKLLATKYTKKKLQRSLEKS